MDFVSNIIASIVLVTCNICGCLAALLIFWKYGKDDIKVYLNGKR